MDKTLAVKLWIAYLESQFLILHNWTHDSYLFHGGADNNDDGLTIFVLHVA